MPKVDPFMIQEFFKEWKSAIDGTARGEIVQNAADTFSVSRQTIHSHFNRIKNGNRTTKKRGRKKNQDPELLKELAIIAGTKQSHKVGNKGSELRTSKAILANIRAGKLNKLSNISEGQVNRLLRQNHLSGKHFKQKGISTKLTARYANHFVLCDASPLPQYYFHLESKIFERRIDIKENVSHIGTVLDEKGLAKVWSYLIRDLYSGAFTLLVFNPTKLESKGGENASDWLKAFSHWIQPKKDRRIPIVGVPKLIMSDGGSWFNSVAFQNMLNSLEIEFRKHLPGRPWAKGPIEGQIGAIQKSAVIALDRAKIHELSEIQKFLDSWVIYHNSQLGYYEKFYRSLQSHPPRIVNPEHFVNIALKHEERKLTPWRTVVIKKEHYFLQGAGANDLIVLRFNENRTFRS